MREKPKAALPAKTTPSDLETTARDSDNLGTLDGLSRRAWFGTAALAFGATCMMSTQASAKLSETLAKYQAEPKGKFMCGICAQFQAPDSCKLVDGKISPTGWCQLYTPKAG